nr:PEP-CTERM sorting domain-containing protein [uncultured Roseateles sp.]
MTITTRPSSSWVAALALAAGLLASPAQAAEQWHLVGSDSFTVPTALYRSQGLTTDGQQWYFSWQYGLERAALNDFTSLQRNSNLNLSNGKLTPGIPLELIAGFGASHIGDIDTYGGKIYAPIEDGNKRADGSRYLNPLIGVFNASDLSYTGSFYKLSHDDLHAGVPWVAVDGAKGLAYTAEWDDTVRINIHKLGDFSSQGYLALDRPLDRIQGAKVWNGGLYASTDDANKTVYRIDLATGHVDELFREDFGVPAGTKIEVEGLSFLQTADKGSLHVLRIVGDASNLADPLLHVALDHYALAPVPEPASLGLMLAGLGLLLGFARRR